MIYFLIVGVLYWLNFELRFVTVRSEAGSKEPLGPIYISFQNSSHIFPGYCRRAVHTRFCTVLLVTVPQFCAPLYGNSVQPVTFADFFATRLSPDGQKKNVFGL